MSLLGYHSAIDIAPEALFYELFPSLNRGVSTRQLNSNEFAFNAKRGPSNSFESIKFKSGKLDNSQLETFAGNDVAYVHQYYDGANSQLQHIGGNIQIYDGTETYLDANGNQAYKFSSSYLDVPFSSIISGEFSFLFYGQFLPSTGAYALLMDSYGVGGRNGFSLYRAKQAAGSSDSITLYNWNGSTYSSIVVLPVNTDVALWEISRGSDNKIRLYKDGLLISTSSSINALNYNPTAKYRIGASLTNTAHARMDLCEFLFFNGSIASNREEITNNILNAFI